MTSNLATKSDLMLVRQEVEHLGQSMHTRFDALDARFAAIDTRFDAVETRIVFKLGALMVALVGLTGTLVKLVG
jgi:hypothetical protein